MPQKRKNNQTLVVNHFDNLSDRKLYYIQSMKIKAQYHHICQDKRQPMTTNSPNYPTTWNN